MNPQTEPSATPYYDDLTGRLVAAEKTVEQLKIAVLSNRDIGAAIGILMAQKRVTQQRAFDLLRQASQNLHVKLRDLARDVIDTGALPDPGADPPTSATAIPKPLVRSQPDLPQSLLRQRITAAIHRGDLRDRAAAIRSAASRARSKAAEIRHEAARQREASGDMTVDATDRQRDIDDRVAEAIDNVWAARDGDEAASDRALLSETVRKAAGG
ncbi:MAG TPA: ANTAR domain-containing protein [Frankiaceae bacterium]|nr:ANTAR domain-containing protein [Frankiaceae bacterium]